MPNRFQSLLDSEHAGLVLNLCEEVMRTAHEGGYWIIHADKIAFRASNGEIYPYDFAKDDEMSRAIVDLFNNAHSIVRNMLK